MRVLSPFVALGAAVLVACAATERPVLAESGAAAFHTPIAQAESTVGDAISEARWTELPRLSAVVEIPAEGTWVIKAQAQVQVRSIDRKKSPIVAVRLLRKRGDEQGVVRWSSRIELSKVKGAPTTAGLALMDADHVPGGSTYTYTIDARASDGRATFNGESGIPGYKPTSYLRAWAERVPE